MPLYEYSCQECRSVFEVLIRSCKDRSEEDRVACPSCTSRNVTKLFSTFSVSSRGVSPSTGQSSCSTCTGGNCSTCH
jgi:putative FmdB family regulatory protein